jgi:hypothetical protein
MLKSGCILLLIFSSNCNANFVNFMGSANGSDFESIFATTETSPFNDFFINFELRLNLNDDWLSDNAGRKYKKLELISAASSLDPFLGSQQLYEARFSHSNSVDFSGIVFLSVSRDDVFFTTPEDRENAFWSLTSGTNDFMFSLSLDPIYQLYGSNLSVAQESSLSLWGVRDHERAYVPQIGTLNVELVSSITQVSEPPISILLFLSFVWLTIIFRTTIAPAKDGRQFSISIRP